MPEATWPRFQETPKKDITLTEAVAEKILQDIISGDLSPGGRLGIDDLKDRYQTGASPIREALTRLLSQGFVTNETRKGFRVSALSEKDLHEITDIRKLIEIHALRLSMDASEPAWEEEIVVHMTRLRFAINRRPPKGELMNAELEGIHKSYHRALVAGCNSRRLLELQETYYDLANRYRRRVLSARAARRGFLERHEKLTDAVLSRNPEIACAELSRHLELNLLGFHTKTKADN